MRDLGEAGDKETENEVLLLEHDVPHQPFSAAVLRDLPTMPWEITDEVKWYNTHTFFIMFDTITVDFDYSCSLCNFIVRHSMIMSFRPVERYNTGERQQFAKPHLCYGFKTLWAVTLWNFLIFRQIYETLAYPSFANTSYSSIGA